ncbi:tetratricopeptide repeat protein [Nocardiopsis aegyptia]|uniref:Sel1 repeat family protein n=1 Tax=Nocardiopsis aegyptia TaxID=220378 RepID=A0A7Z0J915_9ACTN|nr:tetratricopeptide repeat protein [Nocardiopsis aegyptia]NYJ32880.1 hypothetical protein [Nocardiopsis aegyptia]
MPRPWKHPDLPPGPLSELNRALHELHHRAGWPSSREIRRALDAKGVPMSHTKVHDTLTKPVLPTKGAVEMITEVLAEKVRGADINTEIDRLLGLWQAAALDNSSPSPAPVPPDESAALPDDPERPPDEARTPTDDPPTAKQGGQRELPRQDNLIERMRREKAENGDTDAMVELGSSLQTWGGAAGAAEAESWYRRAAESGHTQAMLNLAVLLEEEQEERGSAALWYRRAEAESWYRRAAENGHTQAMVGLGALLEQRDEDDEAAVWYRRAAEKGDAGAMLSFASLLKQRGDDEHAEAWYRRAAEEGDADAMNTLAALLEEREETEEAAVWRHRAEEASRSVLSRLVDRWFRGKS